MPESKHPSVKADSMQRNIAGAVASPAAKPKTPAGKTAKKEGAPVAKKKIARKKAATSAKRASPGTETVSADAGSVPASVGAPRADAAATKPALSRDARQRIIGEAAYLISLKRQAGLSGPEADWLFAETVIDLVFDTSD